MSDKVSEFMRETLEAGAASIQAANLRVVSPRASTALEPLRIQHPDIPPPRQVVSDELLIEIHSYLVLYGEEYISRPGMRPAGELHFSWGVGKDGQRELRCTPTPRSLPVMRRGEPRERKAA